MNAVVLPEKDHSGAPVYMYLCIIYVGICTYMYVYYGWKAQ